MILNGRLETVKPPCHGPRPQKVTDDDMFMAAQRAMSRLGPGELTLAEIAAEAGVTAGAAGAAVRLEARSAAGAVGAFSGGTAEMFARAAARPPLAAGDAARLQRLHGAAWRRAPAAFARNFAYLQIDLTDPDFRKHLAKQARGDARGAAEVHQGSDRRRRAGAGDQRQTAGAHDRSDRQRLDDELGVLPGRHCREVDAARPRRRS